MTIVYDIEVFNKLNFAGFMLDNEQVFWILNAPNMTPDVKFFHGNPIYINQPDAKDKIDAVIREQRWGVPYGFNNHAYDDYLLDDIGAGIKPEFLKQKSDLIISQRPREFFEWVSYDTSEQMPIGFSLKKWEAMAGLLVDESPIGFDYDGEFDNEQIREVLRYNLYDLRATLALVNERKNYFDGKTLLVKEYGWQGSGRYSNGSISARYLMQNDRLQGYRPDEPTITGVPDEAETFLTEALTYSPYVSEGKTATERAKRQKNMTTKIYTEAFGNVFSWGWGGLHSARGELKTSKTGRKSPKYKHETFTDVEQWDVASMFPSIIIRDRLLGDATGKFEKLVKERLKNKAQGNPLAATQKIVINSVYGLLRLNSSRLFNPYAAIHVNVAGMVAIYNLAELLSRHGTVIQVNTDGVAFKPKKDVPEQVFDDLRAMWCYKFNLELEITKFSKLVQRDVNNYVAVTTDGHIKVKGGAVNRAIKQDLTKNTTPRVIQTAVLNALLYDTPVEETIKKTTDPLDFCFTLSAMRGSTQTGYMVDASFEEPKRLHNRVNRVYAATNGHAIMKERTPDANGQQRTPSTFPDAPLKMAVANDILDREKPLTDLDLSYYVELSKKKLAQWR